MRIYRNLLRNFEIIKHLLIKLFNHNIIDAKGIGQLLEYARKKEIIKLQREKQKNKISNSLRQWTTLQNFKWYGLFNSIHYKK